MKTWAWITIVVVMVVGFGAVGGILYSSTVSYSHNIGVLNSFYSERLNEKDAEISELRNTVSDLQLAKSLLVGYLDSETLAKAAISENRNTLERQFRDATRESIGVKERLTEALNKAKVDLNKAKVEAEGLKASLNNEVADKKFLISQYQEAQHRETEIRLDTVKAYQSVLANYELEKEKNKEQEEVVAVTNRRLDIAKKLVESVLIQEFRPVSTKTTKAVKTVIFVSADIKLSIADIDRYRIAAGRAVRLNQLWFFGQLEETFSAEEPVVFIGKKKLAEYDKLSAGERIIEVRKEMNVPWKETFIILLVGSADAFNYGSEFPPTALITGASTNHILEGWNGGAAVVAHELGHVWGLPHLISNDKTAVMMADPDGFAPALNFFPFAILTPAEKDKVRSLIK